MAITKILPRNGGLQAAIQYVLNGDKTDGQVLTARLNCDPGLEYRQMMDTKREVGKLGGRQCYHIIQSFRPGEITPELALEIARQFAEEYLADYEVVIGTHVDRGHIHSHLLFNSVNGRTGQKYHIKTQDYYKQIRAISDRLCQAHGLSVILSGEPGKAVRYIEWLRQSKGQPTFRSMLEADLREAIQSANDLGHFYLLMEHRGYEIKHGNRLGFRLRGQERYMIPGRTNPLFTEEGIRAAIRGSLEEIEAGLRPAVTRRPRYQPYQPNPKYTGFLALYAVRTSTDPDNPQEVATVTEDKLSILREIFWAMNEIAYSTETVTHSSSHTNEDGEVVETTSTETILQITVTTKDYLQIADEYGFSEEQRGFLEELLKPEYQELFMMLTGSYQDLTLSQEEIADIMAQLPANLSEERRQVVLTAYQLVGKVHYFWGGKSTAIGWDSRWGTPMEVTAAGSASTGSIRPFGLDCTGFIDWVLRNAGLPSDGNWYIGVNLTEVSQSEALPGDIALNADASHVGIIVGRNEAGSLLVCHCSSGQDNVVVTEFGISGFEKVGAPLYQLN